MGFWAGVCVCFSRFSIFVKSVQKPGDLLQTSPRPTRWRLPQTQLRRCEPDGGLHGGLCWFGGWGVAGRLVCLCGGRLALLLRPRPYTFCHCAVVVAAMAKHNCLATLYGVSPVPPPPPSPSPPPRLSQAPVGTAPTLAGLRVPPPPPLFPITSSWLPLPGPLCCHLLLLFLHYPLCTLPPAPPLWSAPSASLPPSSYLAALAG